MLATDSTATVVLLHPLLTLGAVPTGPEMGCQQNDSTSMWAWCVYQHTQTVQANAAGGPPEESDATGVQLVAEVSR